MGGFLRMMETFNHPVELWVETGEGRVRNFLRFTDSGPDGECELELHGQRLKEQELQNVRSR